MPADDVPRCARLNLVSIPDGVDEAAVRSALLDEFNLEIGAGLGELTGKTLRIGLMGHAANQSNVIACLTAVEAVLSRQGLTLEHRAAVAVASAYYTA